MHGPGGGVAAAFEGVAPLAETALLAGVDLLTAADETDDDAPLRDALGELDEMLGLGPGRGGVGRGVVAGVLAADLVGVPGALRLVEDEEMLGRDGVLALAVEAHVLLHIPDEDLAPAAGFLEGILKDQHEGAIGTAWCCRGAGPRDRRGSRRAPGAGRRASCPNRARR